MAECWSKVQRSAPFIVSRIGISSKFKKTASRFCSIKDSAQVKWGTPSTVSSLEITENETFMSVTRESQYILFNKSETDWTAVVTVCESDATFFFAKCARAYDSWKQCQWIIRTLTCKHKIWGKNWSYLRPYLKAFPVFNVLETRRVYLLTIDLGIVKFIKKKNYRAVFWKVRNLYACTKLRAKTVTKAAESMFNKIRLTRDSPEQLPPFFVHSFQWNQTTMRWSRVSKAYHFLKKLANCVDSMLFHCFYDA